MPACQQTDNSHGWKYSFLLVLFNHGYIMKILYLPTPIPNPSPKGRAGLGVLKVSWNLLNQTTLIN